MLFSQNYHGAAAKGKKDIINDTRDNDEDCSAEWHIYPECAIESIYKVSLSHGLVSPCPLGHEAHSFLQQNCFLTKEIRADIEQTYGFRPWRIAQRPGDAVFIPPRCPHQVGSHTHCLVSFSEIFGKVSNKKSCVKLAIDFVSICHIDILKRLDNDVRQANMSGGEEQDLAHLIHTLWFSWLSTASMSWKP